MASDQDAIVTDVDGRPARIVRDVATAEDPFGLEDRAAAFIAGFDLGEAHGRTMERALIDQERRSARAGAIVARMATYPLRDRAADRAAAAAREARWSA